MKSLNLLVLILVFAEISFCQDLDLGLQGYFQFNSDFIDKSPNEIEGQGFDINSAIGIENSPETCYGFNGTNSYINLSNDGRNIADQISLSTWIKTTLDKRQFVIANYNSDENKGYFLAIDDGIALIGARDNSGVFGQCTGTTKVDDGEWHHIVGIIDEDFWQIWVDCEIENTLMTNSINTPLLSADPLTVGKWHQGNGNGEFRVFEGLIDEIRIYNRPLIASEIQLLCDLNTVSTDDVIFGSQAINIVPNPVGKAFNVVFENNVGEKITYKIYDSIGRISGTGILNGPISMEEYKTGVYWLHLIGKGQIIAVEKIIKQ